MENAVPIVSCAVCVLSLIVSVVEQNRKFKEMTQSMLDRERERGDRKRQDTATEVRQSAFIEKDLKYIAQQMEETRRDMRRLAQKVDDMHDQLVQLTTRHDHLAAKADHQQERIDDLEQVMRNDAIAAVKEDKK